MAKADAKILNKQINNAELDLLRDIADKLCTGLTCEERLLLDEMIGAYIIAAEHGVFIRVIKN